MLRRTFVGTLGIGVLCTSNQLLARPSAPPIPPIPLRIWVAQRIADNAPTDVVTEEFIAEQLGQANQLFGGFGLSFEDRVDHGSILNLTDLETRQDRNALAGQLAKGSCNVFFVGRLRDVDDPQRHRMGVMWRNLANLKQKYVIVSSQARETTLAHELGHYLGNGHSSVMNNLMSYERDGGDVFLDENQGAKARKTARALFASKELQ
jgi:hypothetical protein